MDNLKRFLGLFLFFLEMLRKVCLLGPHSRCRNDPARIHAREKKKGKKEKES